MRCITCIFLFFFSLCSYAQLAGLVGSYYADINPDTAIDCYSAAGFSHYVSEDFRVDVNGDSQADFNVRGISSGSPAHGSGTISILSLNSSSYILKGRTDSVYNNYQQIWHVSPVAKPLLYGDSLSPSGAAWNTSCTLHNRSYISGAYIDIHDFPDSIDSYAAIKYVDGTAIYYGWIRLTMSRAYPDKTCTVKDYSLYPAVAGIPSSPIGSLLLFPNPALDYLYIKDAGIPVKEIEVFDAMSGRIALATIETDPRTVKVDVSTLAAGIYIVSFQTINGLVRQKLLIKK